MQDFLEAGGRLGFLRPGHFQHFAKQGALRFWEKIGDFLQQRHSGLLDGVPGEGGHEGVFLFLGLFLVRHADGVEDFCQEDGVFGQPGEESVAALLDVEHVKQVYVAVGADLLDGEDVHLNGPGLAVGVLENMHGFPFLGADGAAGPAGGLAAVTAMSPR